MGFRTLMSLRRTGACTAAELHTLLDECEASYLPYGEKARIARLAKEAPDQMLTESELTQRYAKPLGAESLGLARAEYFERVLTLHGPAAFVLEPRVKVGTIHAAKGKEADVVHLVDSWATLPYRNATSGPAGALAEGCVAYVALTRHRVALDFVPGEEGTPYPGF
jgi:superfamily I DNA/RNA helicase